jgi:hypothetical protein
VVVLAEGRVVDQGPPDLVLARLGPPLPGAAATTRAVVAGPHHGQPDAPLASLIRPPAESPLPG